VGTYGHNERRAGRRAPRFGYRAGAAIPTDCKQPVRSNPNAGTEHQDKTMFAVIRTGGKQYRVAAEDVIKVDKVRGDPGEIVQFGEVLVVGGERIALGAPTVAGACVAAEVLEQGRGPKIIAFKKRRRKNSRRKRGHRQEFTLIRVTEILTDGAQPSKITRRKAERRPPAREIGQAPAQETAQTVAPETSPAAAHQAPAAAQPVEAKGPKAKAKAQTKPQAKAKKPAKPPAKSKAAKPKSGGKGKKK
jgi:large subunit ribosomal protein L21